jgi:fibronectin-binding autotransporter adhesin
MGSLNGIVIFQMSGGVIDISNTVSQTPINFAGSNGGNETWAANKSSLNVGQYGTFYGNEGHIRVDALSGEGAIRSGYAGLGSFTFGVNNGSGTFSGQLGDEAGAGHIGRYIKEGWGTQALTGVNTFAGGLAVNGGYVQVNADTGLGVNGGAVTLSGGGLKFGANVNNLRGFTVGGGWGWIDTNGFNVTAAQNISGPGALVKIGGGTLTLGGNNTQGGLVIQGGTVSVASDANLGASGATVTIESGTLALTASIGINRPMTVGNAGPSSGDVSVSAGHTAVWNGNVSGSGNAALWKNDPGNLWVLGDLVLGSVQVNGGSLVALGMVNLSKNAVITNGARLVLNFDTGGGGGDRYYPGSTTFSGAGTLTKTGDGHVHWGSASATFALHSGSLIDVQAGDFSGGNDANETWTNNRSDLRVESGATFYGNEAFVRVDALSDGTFGGGTIRSGWSGAGSLAVGVDDGSGTFSGVVADTDTAGGHIGTLIKEGTGTQTLTGNHTYTGPTIVGNGTLAFTGDTKSSAFTLGFGAATLEFNLASNREYGNATFDGFGILKKTGPGRIFWGGGAATFALNTGSKIDVQSGTFTGGSHDNESWTNNKSDLNVAAGATFEGVEAHVRVDALTGGGTITSGYSPVGPGSFTFGVDNGSGTFSGVLANGSNPGRYTKAGTGTQILTGANTYTGGTTIAAGTLQIGDGGTSGSISGNITNNGALVFDRSGSLTYGNAISGTGTLTKRGPGMLTLTGANTFAGGTTLTAGTLQLGSSGANLPDTGAVQVNGGTLALGASVEIIGSLTLGSQGALAFDLSSAGSYERLSAVNGITLSGGTLRLTLDGGYIPSVGAVFDILDWGGTFSGAFTSLDLPAGITWNTSNLYTNGTLSVVAIPEPTTVGLLVFGGCFLAGVRRRKTAVDL